MAWAAGIWGQIDSTVLSQDFTSIFSHINALQDSGKFDQAINLALATKAKLEPMKEDSAMLYTKSLFRLGEIHMIISQAEKAKTYLIAAKAFHESHPGLKPANYGEILHVLGMLSLDMAKYEEARSYFTEAQAVLLPVYNESHDRLATLFTNIGYFYSKLGRYDTAQTYYFKAKKILENLDRTQSKGYTRLLNNLGLGAKRLGDFESGQKYFLQAKAGWEDLGLAQTMDYATTLHNLGSLHNGKLEFELAEKYLLAANTLFGSILGKKHNNYCISLLALGQLYTTTGQVELAEKVLLEAKQIQEQILSPRHPNYGRTLRDLGSLYHHTGQYDLAITYFKKAFDIFSGHFGDSSIYVSMIYKALSSISLRTAQYDSAEYFAQKSQQILLGLYGEEHPNYATSLAGLGFVYKVQGKYDQAEKCLSRAVEINRKVIGRTNLDSGVKQALLGEVYTCMGDYPKAQKNLLEAEAILLQSEAGIYYRDYPLVMRYLGNYYRASGNDSLATLYLIKAAEAESAVIHQKSKFFSEREVLAISNHVDMTASMLFSMLASNSSEEASIARWAFDNRLFQKGFLLHNSSLIPRLIAEKPDSVQQMFATWQGLHRQIAKGNSQPSPDRNKQKDLTEKANKLEKKLIQQIEELGKNDRQYSWDQVQKVLKPNELVLEFVHFPYYQTTHSDSMVYGALILKPGWEHPRFIRLFEQSELESLLENSSAHGPRQAVNKSYGPPLYRLIWKPLEEVCKGTKRIYYSPEGLLHRISLPAIPISDSLRLIDQYELVYISTSRNLIFEENTPLPFPKTASIYGNISYDWDTTAMPSVLAEARGVSFSFLPDDTHPQDSSRGRIWYPLSKTKEEVSRLGKVFMENKIPATLLQEYQATEESFLSLGKKSPSPSVLHIATHGFFFDDPQLSEGERAMYLQGGKFNFQFAQNPLFRSGLIMAGANKAWEERKTVPGREDGILTAYEIARQDLSSTQLVTLSACKTGLGDIRGSEGVYGLQRAFKLAGADYLLLTLWSIPDSDETVEFMEKFYQKWLSGAPIPQAFSQTQKEMRAAYPDPYYWAGFVLVD